MSEVRELLPLYALGLLAPDEAARVERAMASDPALAAELASFEEAASAMIAPVEPSPEVHARLLAAIGGGRFERFTAQLARMFGVSLDHARALLGLIERSASWAQGAPGIGLVHFAGGPACAAADCGFVRLEPGIAFPLHTHAGEEVSLILAGRLLDRGTGRVHVPGDEIVAATGTPHDVVCDGDSPCIYAARAEGGIEIGGVSVRPQKN